MNFVRELKLKTDGNLQTVRVALSEPSLDRGTWICRYVINWPEGPNSDDIGGADALQALYLAMQAVALAIYASPHHKQGRLYWDKPGRGYGFPMPKPGRGDLVGEDRVSQL
jgi:uncharacterized protein DUF6968